jgi:putative aldouronate transport system substrate-binding protein
MRKKVICALLAAMMASSFLAGCKSNKVAEPSNGSSPTAKNPDKPYLDDTTPITIDWFIDDPTVSRAKWGQDLVTQNITKKTGINVNMIVATGDAAAKKAAMIASNSLTDLLSIPWYNPEWKTMVQGGMLWSINELEEKYDKKLTSVMYKSTLDLYKEKDGKTYVYPGGSWPAEEAKNARYIIPGGSISVKQDIYEAIGKPDMSTPEGFLNALKLAKEKFPTIDGKPIVPFQIGGEFTAADGNAFFFSTLPLLLNKPHATSDGKFVKEANRKDPEVFTWIKTFRKAYELGYIGKDQFTNKKAQIDDQFNSGVVFATGMAANTVAGFNNKFYAKDPKAAYIPIQAIQNSKKEPNKYYATSATGYFVNMVSKSTKYPERIAKFLHYMLSAEGQEDFFYGDESMYIMKDGKKYLKDEIYDMRSAADGGKEFFTKYAARDTYYMLQQSNYNDKFVQKVDTFKVAYFDFFKGKFEPATKYDNNNPDANTPAAIAFTKDKTLYADALVKTLTAKDDADCEKFWNEYKKQSDELQKEWQPAMQAKYDAKIANMGK